MKQMLSSLDDLDKAPDSKKRIVFICETISNYAISWANMFSSLADVSMTLLDDSKDEHCLLKEDVKVNTTAAALTAEAVFYFGPLHKYVQQRHDQKLIYMWPVDFEPSMGLQLESSASSDIAHTIELVRHSQKPHEIWLAPQSVYCAPLIDRMFQGPTIRTVPQLWTSRFEMAYGSESKDSSKGIDIAVLSDMCSDSNSLLYSLMMCETLVKEKPEYVNNILILRDKPIEQGTLDLIKMLGLESKVKTVLAKEEAVVPYFHKRSTLTFFLYHQNDHTEKPELLWDLMWTGVPVVHNVKTAMDVGLKYTDNAIHDAVKLLQVNKIHLDAAYLQKNRHNLTKLRNGQGRALDFLLSLDVAAAAAAKAVSAT
jgi:hypothetical protein